MITRRSRFLDLSALAALERKGSRRSEGSKDRIQVGTSRVFKADPANSSITASIPAVKIYAASIEGPWANWQSSRASVSGRDESALHDRCRLECLDDIW